MTSAPSTVLPAERLRALLRRLRDADLRLRNVALSALERVSIEGCISLDSPVEQDLGYLLRWPSGQEEVLWISAAGGTLRLLRSDRSGRATADGREALLFADPSGRAICAPWRARIDPERAGLRELGFFLRRLVRSALATERADGR